MSVSLHTNFGDIKVELACDRVPRLARNFLALCASHAYDSSRFHRNVAGFMLQGGDPTGTGKKGFAINGAYLDDEFHPSLRHSRRGILAFANRGPNTNGSQFYITYAAASHLDNVSSVIGQVIDGFDTLDNIEKVQVDAKYRPLQPVLLEGVTIHANPIAEEEG